MTRPPTEAPIASIADQAALGKRICGHQLRSRCDARNRGGSRRLEERRRRDGQRHDDVGDPDLSAIWRTSSSPRINTPRIRSAAIISRRRSMRSTTTPAMRSDEGYGKKLHDHHPRHGSGRSGEIEQERATPRPC